MWNLSFLLVVAALLRQGADSSRAASAAPRGEVRTRYVHVFANRRWTPTGARLGPGQTIRVEAAGVVEMARRDDARPFYHGVPPEGRRETSLQMPEPGLPALALIGRVGNGPVFVVGPGIELRADSVGVTGELILGPNDDMIEDNARSWTVRVVVTSRTEERTNGGRGPGNGFGGVGERGGAEPRTPKPKPR